MDEIKVTFRGIFKKSICIACIFYVLVTVGYGVTIGEFEAQETKGVGICNAVFLLFTDFVILSLPEKPNMVELGAQQIYHPGF